ncbi:hypothetical protein FOA52_010311, partial [Chlamydomonas sp. UWO 241]
MSSVVGSQNLTAAAMLTRVLNNNADLASAAFDGPPFNIDLLNKLINIMMAMNAEWSGVAAALDCLSGPPGSGKIFLLKHLVHNLRRTGKVVVLSAMTGTAAVRLSEFAGMTHSTFSIPVGGEYVHGVDLSNPVFQVQAEAAVNVVDEMSMATQKTLSVIMQRLTEVDYATHSDDALGSASALNRIMLIIGDHAQLPPVCHCNSVESDSFCLRCHITSSPYWPMFTMHHLTMSVRHANDKPCAAFLDSIRTDPPTAPRIAEVLEQCFMPEDTDIPELLAE